MILEILRRPDADGKQEVEAVIESTSKGFKASGRRASAALWRAGLIRHSLAAATGQIDRDTLQLIGQLPSAEETLRYWLDKIGPRERLREGQNSPSVPLMEHNFH